MEPLFIFVLIFILVAFIYYLPFGILIHWIFGSPKKKKAISCKITSNLEDSIEVESLYNKEQNILIITLKDTTCNLSSKPILIPLDELEDNSCVFKNFNEGQIKVAQSKNSLGDMELDINIKNPRDFFNIHKD